MPLCARTIEASEGRNMACATCLTLPTRRYLLKGDQGLGSSVALSLRGRERHHQFGQLLLGGAGDSICAFRLGSWSKLEPWKVHGLFLSGS